MGVNIVERDRVGVKVEAREEERPRIPGWFWEAVLWGQYWLLERAGRVRGRRSAGSAGTNGAV